MAPLRKHLEDCVECRGTLDGLAQVVAQLESLPHFRPAPLFADRLMARVEVYQPWHVAARDFLGRLIPESSAGRVVMGGLGATAAAGVTAGLVWVGQRADAVLFVGSYSLQRAREGLAASVIEATTSLLGAGAADTIQNGGPVVLTAATGAAVLGVFGVAAAVKGIATAQRRRD